MNKRKIKLIAEDPTVSPGINPEDSYGEKATKTEIEKGESTSVTRLTYDEYDPSGR